MERIAILAGGGRLPIVLAESINAHGGRAHIVAVRGEAGPEIESLPHTWVTWGSVNAILATLKRESNGTMMIAGSVSRPNLWHLKPDFGLIRYLPQILQMLKGGDDAVLTRLIRFFEAHGLTVKGVSDIAPELLAQAGHSGTSTPVPQQARDDAALGFRILDALADLDVGQAIALEHGRILAIEGAEGTDRMLQRIASLDGRRVQGAVLVKGPKRGQDLRVDVPTVGAKTIDSLASARVATMVVVAGKTLLLERDEMLRRADAAAISLLCLDRDPPHADVAVARSWRRTQLPSRHGTMLGRRAPNAADSRDACIAAEVMRRLQPFGTGQAAVVVREHVLAVAAAEGPIAMAKRIAVLRQWGRGRTGRGALAVAFDAALNDPSHLMAMIENLDGAGLAGVAIVLSGVASAQDCRIAAAVALADKLGLFLIALEADAITPAIEAA